MSWMTQSASPSSQLVTRPARILVADDQAMIRDGVRLLFESQTKFHVCGEAVNGQEAIDKAQELLPDLIIIDITMPVLNGFDAARMIRKLCPNVPILILSMHNSKQLIEEARKIGARGYVAKMEMDEHLVDAVHSVLKNGTFFPLESQP
jgi:two-component system nitrate/nitrite response regulator NarL